MREKPIAEDSVIAFRRARRLARERHHAAAPERRARQIAQLADTYRDVAKRMSPAARKRLSSLAAKHKGE